MSTTKNNRKTETPEKGERVNFLASLITKAKQAYYFSGQPIMSDAEYDALEEELGAIHPQHPLLKTVGAPVPAGAGHLARVKHRMMMGSQSKVNSEEDFRAWCGRRGGDMRFHCSLKADGCSIAAYYDKGRLVQVVTRGDGVEGEDVTANALSFKGLPVILPRETDCAVRLEAVLTVADWKAFDPDGESNPRSLANGILGRKDGKNAGLLTTLAFDVDGIAEDTEEGKSLWLEEAGFQTTTWGMVESQEEVGAFLAAAQKERDAGNMAYWADGVVVKINDLGEQKRLGVTSGRPKGQVAWKFAAEKAVSEILEVDWTVGHTGAVTPVARVAPVRLGGTTVQKVSLSNPELIEALGIREGSRVEVVKAGDIIPKITKVVEAGGGEPIATPSCCPACEAKLEKLSNVDGSESTVIYCRNTECEAQTTGRVRRWAKSRDVLGLGDSVIEALCEGRIVREVPDLFELKPTDIENVIINKEKNIRLGSKRAESICAEIRSKGTRMPLAEFLGSFGTRKLGVRRATLMIEANPELNNLEKWFDGSLSDPTFAAKAGVPNSGVQILEGLRDRETVIRKAAAHIQLEETKPKPENGARTVCITGSLPSGKKKSEWSKPLEAAGYQLVDSVSKDLYALVVSDTSVETSKSKKAAKMGIRIISEEQLAELCTGREATPANPVHPLPRAKTAGDRGTPGKTKASREV